MAVDIHPIPAEAPVDLEVFEGTAALDDDAEESGPYRLAGDTLLFERRGVARYLCRAGRQIVVEAASGARDADVSASLTATALPAAMWMRGELVLHAAAVVLPGHSRAVAIGGESGSGKSTILRQLVAIGASVVADDTVCVRVCGASVHVSGLSAVHFQVDTSSVDAHDRISCAVPRAQQLPSAELAALVVLALPRVASGGEFKPVRDQRVLEVLFDSRHRPRVPRLLRSEAGLLQKFARLAEQVPVYTWSRLDGARHLTAGEVTFLDSAIRSNPAREWSNT
jgi:hypothetical protein